MVVVAIAGGTSAGLGRSITKALLADGKHTPIILSRLTSNTPEWVDALNIEVRKVDYSAKDSLVKGLTGVHTVISVLLCKDGTWNQAQLNLLDAALGCGAKRFAPSEFGVGPLANAQVELLAEQNPIYAALKDAKRKVPDFSYTGFYSGAFLNYLGYGCSREAEAVDGKSWDGLFIFNVKEMTAEVPMTKDGKFPRITMTTLADIGKFVSAAVDSTGNWPEETYMAGQTLGIDEVIRIVEKVRGKSMKITRLTPETLDEQLKACPPEDFMQRFWIQLMAIFAEDTENMGYMPLVSEELAGVRTVKVEEYVQEFWGSEE